MYSKAIEEVLANENLTKQEKLSKIRDKIDWAFRHQDGVFVFTETIAELIIRVDMIGKVTKEEIKQENEGPDFDRMYRQGPSHG